MTYEELLVEADKNGLITKEKPLIAHKGRIKGKQITIKREISTLTEKSCVLAEEQAYYTIRYDKIKRLCNGSIRFEDLQENDYCIEIAQKGVDMKIGLDIASMSYKRQVDQIILISGDSDFVSAAKLARREGIDFILDPLGAPIKPDLNEHIDGLRTCDAKYINKEK